MTSSALTCLSKLWQLNDWHHCSDECTENVKMFAEKITKFYRMPKHPISSQSVYSGADNTELLEALFFQNHEDTVSENKGIFVDFFNKLSQNGVNVIIIIPPVYLNGLNKASQVAISNKKEKFYRIVRELESVTGKVPVYDFSSRFAAKRENFFDCTHLNTTGAIEFTEILNSEVLEGYP